MPGSPTGGLSHRPKRTTLAAALIASKQQRRRENSGVNPEGQAKPVNQAAARRWQLPALCSAKTAA
jgi:hypothetical protein